MSNWHCQQPHRKIGRGIQNNNWPYYSGYFKKTPEALVFALPFEEEIQKSCCLLSFMAIVKGRKQKCQVVVKNKSLTSFQLQLLQPGIDDDRSTKISYKSVKFLGKNGQMILMEGQKKRTPSKNEKQDWMTAALDGQSNGLGATGLLLF